MFVIFNVYNIIYEKNMEIIVPIGVPGAGKTTLYKKKYSDYILISTDEIRKELTGSKSDQSRDEEVFTKAYDLISDCVNQGISIYYDATNVSTKRRKDFFDRFKGTDVKIIYIVFPLNSHLYQKRIKIDLENNIDRADISDELFKSLVKSYKKSRRCGFKDENVQEIRYIKLDELN